jgi:hypothetical protein
VASNSEMKLDRINLILDTVSPNENWSLEIDFLAITVRGNVYLNLKAITLPFHAWKTLRAIPVSLGRIGNTKVTTLPMLYRFIKKETVIEIKPNEKKMPPFDLNSTKPSFLEEDIFEVFIKKVHAKEKNLNQDDLNFLLETLFRKE